MSRHYTIGFNDLSYEAKQDLIEDYSEQVLEELLEEHGNYRDIITFYGLRVDKEMKEAVNDIAESKAEMALFEAMRGLKVEVGT